MKKSAKKVNLAHLAAVLLDVIAWKPGLRTVLEADYIRLEKLVESRGLPIIMIELPNGCKVLDSALSRGEINPENLPGVFGRVLRCSRVLFHCLFEGIFDDDCTIKSGSEVGQYVFFLRQLLLMYKKVVEPCSADDVEKAIAEYTTIESAMRKPTNSWSSDRVLWLESAHFHDGLILEEGFFSDKTRISPKLVEKFQQVCDLLAASFPQVDYRDLQPGHGPGAVADMKTGTDKYLFPNWPEKLEGFFPFCYFAQHREDLYHGAEMLGCKNEPPARLIAVPKTLDKPRIIASEPVAHQYCQQSIMVWLRKNLPGLVEPFVSFHSQIPSRELALSASVTGDLATVDLSSASDRLSCWVVERALRRNTSLLDALHACRTRWMVINHPVGRWTEYLLLRKFASQGSATTFPIQSLVYMCAAIAASLFEDGRAVSLGTIRKYRGKLRVFGDDIILPSRAVRNLDDLLSFLGLKINMRKTHYSGHFRESCGMDAFHGVGVNPTYVQHLSLDITAESLESWVDVSNNAYHNGLWNLASFMVECIPSRVRKLIMIGRVPCSAVTLITHQGSPDNSRARWNKNHHVWEVPCLAVQGKTVQGERSNYQNLLQYFLETGGRSNDSLSYLDEKTFKAGFLRKSSSNLKKSWVQVPF